MGEAFVLTKKENGEEVVVDSVVDGENRTIVGNDGKRHTGIVRVRKIYCGKKCKGCPHPSYAYLKYRDGKKVKEKYLGKVNDDKE